MLVGVQVHRIGLSAQQLLLVQPCAESTTALAVRIAVPFAALASCEVDELDPRTMVLAATAPIEHEAGETSEGGDRWRLRVHFTASAECFDVIGRLRARCESWATARLQRALTLVSSAAADEKQRNDSGKSDALPCKRAWLTCRLCRRAARTYHCMIIVRLRADSDSCYSSCTDDAEADEDDEAELVIIDANRL